MEVVTVKELVNFIMKKIYIVPIIVLIVVTLGMIYTCNIKKPIYTAEIASVLNNGDIQDNNTNIDTNSISTEVVALNRELLNTYIEIIKSEKVVNEVIQELNLEETSKQLKENIEIKNEDNSQFIQIRISNTDKTVAISIANQIGVNAKKEIANLYKKDVLTIMEGARIISDAENIHGLKDFAMYIIAGIILSGVYMVVYYYLDETVKNARNVENIVNLPVVGKLPVIKSIRQQEEVDQNIKELVENIIFKNKQCIAIVGNSKKDGKTVLSYELIRNLIRGNKKVLFVNNEIHYKENSKSKYYDNELITIVTFKEIFMQKNNELKTDDLINQARQKYDFIIFDCNYMMNSELKKQILTKVDEAVVIAIPYVTKVEKLRKTVETLRKLDVSICGVVFNKVNRNFEGYDKINERK